MKRKFYTLLCMVLVLFVMTGCYSTDMNIKIGMSGKIGVDGQLVATEDALSGLFSDESGNDSKTLIKEQIDVLNNFYKENQTDAKSAVIEPESIKDKNGNTMNGIKYSFEFDSLNQMLSSRLFNSVNNIFPIASSEAAGAPITLTETTSMFGTTYSAKGTFGVLGQYGGQVMDDTTANIKNAQAKITFEFPSLFIKSNATEKASLGRKLTWIVTSNQPTELSLSAFVPNLALVIAALIILLLLVVIFVLLNKIKKIHPDEITEVEDDSIEDILFEEPENELDFDELAGEAEEVFMDEELAEEPEIETEEPADTDGIETEE